MINLTIIFILVWWKSQWMAIINNCKLGRVLFVWLRLFITTLDIRKYVMHKANGFTILGCTFLEIVFLMFHDHACNLI